MEHTSAFEMTEVQVLRHQTDVTFCSDYCKSFCLHKFINKVIVIFKKFLSYKNIYRRLMIGIQTLLKLKSYKVI
jgi:hypothetical protein